MKKRKKGEKARVKLACPACNYALGQLIAAMPKHVGEDHYNQLLASFLAAVRRAPRRSARK